jgi:hypothetical protein
MITQNIPDNFQIKVGLSSEIHSKKLIIILGSFICVAVLAISFWFYKSSLTIQAPVPVTTKPVGWTTQDAAVKTALVDSVGMRSTQPLSAQAIKAKQNILRSINRK